MSKLTTKLLVGLAVTFCLFAATIDSASAVTWAGPNSGGVWSTDSDWTGGVKPGASDDVVFNRTGTNITTTMDEDFTINSLSWTGVFGNITINGTNTLKAATYTKPTMATFVNVPVELDQTTTFNANGGGGWTFSGAITESGGAQKILHKGGDQLRLIGNNSFSGGIDVENGSLRFQDDALGSGAIVLGANGGAGKGNLFPDFATSYPGSTNSVTVKAGTGDRDLFNQSTGTISLPLIFTLEKDLRLRLGTNDILTLTGAASGAGGFNAEEQIQNPETELTSRFQLNLNGTYTYSGTTTVAGEGTVTLNTTLANGNIVIAGSVPGLTDPEGIFNGTGSIFFNDGDIIDVNAKGRLDASSLQFDLTNLTTDTAILVDYSDSGAFDGPVGALNDLLNTASLDLGWVLEDTGSQILASIPPVPEPGTLGLMMIGLVGVLMARRRKGSRG